MAGEREVGKQAIELIRQLLRRRANDGIDAVLRQEHDGAEKRAHARREVAPDAGDDIRVVERGGERRPGGLHVGNRVHGPFADHPQLLQGCEQGRLALVQRIEDHDVERFQHALSLRVGGLAANVDGKARTEGAVQ